MHPDLAPHLHSKKCNDIIEKLKKCHEEHKYSKFLGACNEIDASLSKCLKQEREDNRKNNKKVNAPSISDGNNDKAKKPNADNV